MIFDLRHRRCMLEQLVHVVLRSHMADDGCGAACGIHRRVIGTYVPIGSGLT